MKKLIEAVNAFAPYQTVTSASAGAGNFSEVAMGRKLH